jgi:hypothetical protein
MPVGNPPMPLGYLHSKGAISVVEKCRKHCPAGVRPSAEEAMALIEEIDRLRADLKMALLKVRNAKERAITARDNADLAVQYAIDCETLIARACG